MTELPGDACIACVGPKASDLQTRVESWFEGNGYTPNSFIGMSSESFRDHMIAFAEECYLDDRAEAFMVGDRDDDLNDDDVVMGARSPSR